MKKIIVLGATSAVAQACAKLWAEQGHDLFLVGRNSKKLEAMVLDLKVRSRSRIESLAVDLVEIKEHATIFSAAKRALGKYDHVLIAHGILGDQRELQKDFLLTQKALDVNLMSVLSLLTIAANELEVQGNGHIGVITSVAGDRGRQSNYIYGMCKGSVSIFLSGLRNRLFSKGVSVTDIKMGFVDSPMTRHIENKGLLWKKPELVGKIIVKAMDGNGGTHYVPGFWRLIMFIIKSIPESVFKRLSL